MATGGGYTDFQESMSSLGVPVMAKKTFIATEKKIGKWWWDLLEESMSAAEREEHETKSSRQRLGTNNKSCGRCWVE